MKFKLEKYMPPGHSFRVQGTTWLLGVVFSLVYSFRFFDEYQIQHKKVLATNTVGDPGVFMKSFWEVLGSSLNAFYVVAFLMLLFVFWNLYSFYDGSKSIYLMKRISKKELYRRIFTLPLVTAVAAMGLAGIMMLIYWGIYCGMAPKNG